MNQTSGTYPTAWQSPPFIKNPVQRWILLLGILCYLLFALGSLEVNWQRVYVGLDRGAKFLWAFANPDFSTRWKDISEGLLESLMMTVTSTVIGITGSIPIGLEPQKI